MQLPASLCNGRESHTASVAAPRFLHVRLSERNYSRQCQGAQCADREHDGPDDNGDEARICPRPDAERTGTVRGGAEREDRRHHELEQDDGNERFHDLDGEMLEPRPEHDTEREGKKQEADVDSCLPEQELQDDEERGSTYDKSGGHGHR